MAKPAMLWKRTMSRAWPRTWFNWHAHLRQEKTLGKQAANALNGNITANCWQTVLWLYFTDLPVGNKNPPCANCWSAEFQQQTPKRFPVPSYLNDEQLDIRPKRECRRRNPSRRSNEQPFQTEAVFFGRDAGAWRSRTPAFLYSSGALPGGSHSPVAVIRSGRILGGNDKWPGGFHHLGG